MCIPNLTKGWTLYERLVMALIILEIAHVFVLLINSSFPLPLLYGPLFWSLYCCFLGKSSKKVVKHLFVYNIPFFVFAVWNVILGDEITWTYYKWYLPVMVVIQILFPILILLKMRKEKNNSERNVLIKQQMALGIGISVFVATLFLKHYLEFDFEINVDPIYTITVILLFSIGGMLNYLYTYYLQYRQKSEPLVFVEERLVDVMEEAAKEECALMLSSAMEIEKLYLDPRLSLEKLSNYTSLPRNTISQYLHNVLGYSYYEWLATYRIKHALELLEQDNIDYKLEAIAYASGFSSKTTFNRYFKEIVGILPSLYRNKISME